MPPMSPPTEMESTNSAPEPLSWNSLQTYDQHASLTQESAPGRDSTSELTTGVGQAALNRSLASKEECVAAGKALLLMSHNKISSEEPWKRAPRVEKGDGTRRHSLRELSFGKLKRLYTEHALQDIADVSCPWRPLGSLLHVKLARVHKGSPSLMVKRSQSSLEKGSGGGGEGEGGDTRRGGRSQAV